MDPRPPSYETTGLNANLTSHHMSMETQRQKEIENIESNEPLATQTVIPSDGGLKAWSTVVGGYVCSFLTVVHYGFLMFPSRWLALFVAWGYANSFGVYQDFYTRAQTSSPSNISWIGSVQLFFFFSMGLPAGKLLDKGYFRHVMLTGSLIYVFSFVLSSFLPPAASS